MNSFSLRSLLNWSVPVGRLFGIRIRLHITILLFLWPALSASGVNLAHSLEYAVLVVLSILVHELGHALTAKACRQTDLEIMLHGFGGFAQSSGIRSPKLELLIVLAGPLASLILGLVLTAGTHSLTGQALSGETMYQAWTLNSIGHLNIILAIFNMIPCLPWDGGRTLAALIWFKTSYHKALRYTAHLGLLIAVPMAIYGFIHGGWLLLFFGVSAFYSYSLLAQTGGVRFREPLDDYRSWKDEKVYQQRRKEKQDAYIGEVIDRQREREEQERLRKLLE